jgi:hypothetical protein
VSSCTSARVAVIVRNPTVCAAGHALPRGRTRVARRMIIASAASNQASPSNNAAAPDVNRRATASQELQFIAGGSRR